MEPSSGGRATEGIGTNSSRTGSDTSDIRSSHIASNDRAEKKKKSMIGLNIEHINITRNSRRSLANATK
jgi:hypothetical protein